VRTAPDGARGLELAVALRPDVVVSDVSMPELDGYGLCRALRAREDLHAMPVILVTAAAQGAQILDGFRAGANDYVVKPFRAEELLARVDVHVRVRHLVREIARRERMAMLGGVAAAVAHQVRNPLTTLASGLPAMRRRLEGKLDASSAELVDVMVECAARIERTTNDLMDLSRVDRDGEDEVTPGLGLLAAVRLAKTRVGTADVTLAVEVDDTTAIQGRASDLNHVFLNLMDNAIRAVGTRGAIEVRGGVDGERYVVRVGDSGPGVPPELAQHVFEPFWTSRPAGEGTGLGLAIAREVVQQHGGSIAVGRSALGGALFTLSLPLRRAASSASPQAPAA
jgi:signal transduction histidine kinase